MRKLLAASVVSITALAGACWAIGCGDELPAGGDNQGPPDGSVDAPGDSTPPNDDASTADGSSAKDASNDAANACDVVQPNGALYQANFDSNCEGWAVENGDIQPVADPRRCGAGACRVCVSGAGGQPVLYRFIYGVKRTNGIFEADFSVQDESIDAGLSAALFVYTDGGIEIGNGANVRSIAPGQWSLGQVVVSNTNGTSDYILVRIFPPPVPSGCFFIDEVRIGHY